jgi:hypothetical protein
MRLARYHRRSEQQNRHTPAGAMLLVSFRHGFEELCRYSGGRERDRVLPAECDADPAHDRHHRRTADQRYRWDRNRNSARCGVVQSVNRLFLVIALLRGREQQHSRRDADRRTRDGHRRRPAALVRRDHSRPQIRRRDDNRQPGRLGLVHRRCLYAGFQQCRGRHPRWNKSRGRYDAA